MLSHTTSARKTLGLAGAAAALLIGLPACTSAPSSHAAAPASSQPAAASAMSCAWPSEANAQTDNTETPDSASAVWIEPITTSGVTSIVLSGRFPDARYAALSVYTPGGAGTSLPDYRITPQPGSSNPWQRPAAPGGRFTVTIRPDPAPGQANTLPLPAGVTRQHPGYLVYRVYLPAGNDFAAVPLPALTVRQAQIVRQAKTVRQAQTTRTVPGCRSHDGPVPVLKASTSPATSPAASPATSPAASPATSPPTPRQLQFYQLSPATAAAGFADPDNSYAVAYLLRPPVADVAVITAKAPAFPSGSHPSPWPAPGQDVRYWSMCLYAGIEGSPLVANQLPSGGTDYGCRADQATTLNAAGYYTYVIGSEAQRAAISHVAGVTFLPFSTAHPDVLYRLILRNTLASPSFTHSPQDIKQAVDPAAAAAAMGPYYPRAAICPLATLTAQGPQTCLSSTAG